MGRFLWRLRKKILKRWARNAFFPGWRVRLLRWCGYRIGQDVYVADDLLLAEELEDRDNLTLGERVRSARGPPPPPPAPRPPIVVEPDVWLGAGVVVLPGVRIGRGAIVGANSVVTTDVPPLHVVARPPAKTIRVLTPPPDWS